MSLKDRIYNYLYGSGMRKTREIYNHVKSYKPTTTENSVCVTLWSNKHIFVNKGYGLWDIKENSLKEREEKLVYKLIVLNYYYQKLFDESGINGDARLAGIDFTKPEQKIMAKYYEKYKEDKDGENKDNE